MGIWPGFLFEELPSDRRSDQEIPAWAIALDETNEKYLDDAHFIAFPAHTWVLSRDQIEMIK